MPMKASIFCNILLVISSIYNVYIFNLQFISMQNISKSQDIYVSMQSYQKNQAHQVNPYFQLIQKVGSSGRYQCLILIPFTIQLIILGCYMLNQSILYLQSQPDCDGIILPKNQSCANYVCTLNQSEWTKFYPNQIDSIANSFGRLLICQYSYFISFLQSALYIGVIISYFSYSYISDNYGRKFSLIISNITSIIGIIFIVVGQNIPLKALGIILFSLGMGQVQPIAFMIYNQQCHATHRLYYEIIVASSPSIGALIVSPIFQKHPHWKQVIIFLMLIPFVISFFFTYLIQQSPRILIRKDPQKALQSLKRIGKMNGMSQQQLKLSINIEELYELQKILINKQQNIEISTSTISILKVFKFKSLRFAIISFSFLAICIALMYTGPILMMAQFGFDIYTNQLVMMGSQLVATLITFLFLNCKRKLLGYFCFSISAIVNLILILYKQPLGCEKCYQLYIILAISSLSRFFLSLYITIVYIYQMELFPGAARGICYGIINICSSCFNICIPYILNLFRQKQMNAMILFLVASIIGIFCLIPLKQTLNMKLQEQIQQLKNT